MLGRILALLVVVTSQIPAPTALDLLAGRWHGKGNVSGRVVQAELEFRPVLENRFVRLEYRFEAEDVAVGVPGNPFGGHAYYAACRGTDCTGHWFDSLGTVYTLRATQTSTALTSEWSDPTGVKGRTEYRVTGPHELIVTDWVRTAGGEWRQFGLVTYARVR